MKKKGEKIIFISVAELAKMLGVSRITIFNRIKKGQIPALKIGRPYAISMEDVSNLVSDSGSNFLTEDKKADIKKAVEKVVREYGETLRLLGKE